MPNRKAPKTAPPTGKIDAFIGLLAGKTKKQATIEEMNEAAEDGWAGFVSLHEEPETKAIKRRKSKRKPRMQAR